MEIGLFQLENLIYSRAPFIFLDIRDDRSTELPADLKRCLAHAQPVAKNELLSVLNKQSGAKEKAVLLVSENAATSEAARSRLEAEGYTNIYILAGGLEGVLSEF